MQARREWPAAQLAHAVGVPVDVLRARSMFWINQGVIAEERTAAGLVRSPPLASVAPMTPGADPLIPCVVVASLQADYRVLL